MKKIGIFLGYGPNQPIKSHGLGRLLAFILQGMLENKDKQIVIATPAWHKDIILEFLDDQKIDPDKIEFITTPGIPYILRLQNLFAGMMRSQIRLAKFNVFGKFLKSCLKITNHVVIKWLSVSSTSQFALIGIMLFIIGIFVSPIILFALSMLFVIKIAQKGLQKIKFLISKSSLALFAGPLSSLKNYPFAQWTYTAVRLHEMRKLTYLMNKQKNISVWFIPTLFWPEIEYINAKKVVAAPDIIFVDFVASFLASHVYMRSVYENIQKTLKAADHFICYSDYVKEKHLFEKFYINPTKISVIPHGFVDLCDQHLEEKGEKSRTDVAIDLLQTYQRKNLNNSKYLWNFPLSSMRFIFYSSHIRPHKNILNLIKAYEILLRERFINIKLVITGNLHLKDATNEKINSYIREKKLEHDVLSFSDVPSDVLAALNHLAICSVNPTLFEGGFPFTFTEAYSVGTPSVMSQIPMVTPMIPTELRKKMLFDPYDLNDMVNKIEWGIKNRETLFKLQKPLYETFKQRTWKVVANEYITLLDELATAKT